MSKYGVAGYSRPDPLGIQAYHVPYSLNKKKRWQIPDEIEDGLEKLQVSFSLYSETAGSALFSLTLFPQNMACTDRH